jgi:SNF2 family DNA or RNA helicase
MLLRAFFSDQTIKELARVLNQTHPDYQTEQYEHVVEDLMEMSDFELSKLIRNYQPASKFALDPSAFRTLTAIRIQPLIFQLDLLYQSSGKFRALAKLLPELRKEGHRVLIFSQMTKYVNALF